MKKPEVGDVVEFLGRNVHEFQIEQAKKKLKVGGRYTVSDIFADMWGIYLYLDGVPNKSYRSEMFALITPVNTEGEETDAKPKRKVTRSPKTS